MKELREWTAFTDNRNIEPHFHLAGKVYGDSRFSDGDSITTSRVKSIVDGVATTRSGSQYKLVYCQNYV